jgi:hypothetical protein
MGDIDSLPHRAKHLALSSGSKLGLKFFDEKKFLTFCICFVMYIFATSMMGSVREMKGLHANYFMRLAFLLLR